VGYEISAESKERKRFLEDIVIKCENECVPINNIPIEAASEVSHIQMNYCYFVFT
jgi:hypothetical protein